MLFCTKHTKTFFYEHYYHKHKTSVSVWKFVRKGFTTIWYKETELIVFLYFPLPDGTLLKTGITIQIPAAGPAT